MAISTEATVREVIADTIRSIAQDSLGFDAPTGNVRTYPIEMHHAERLAGYLKASVDGRQIPRCWAVDVRAHDEPFALRNISKRTYAITVTGYYAKGENGEGYLSLVDHARAVRGAIRGLTNNLSNTVSLIQSATPLDISETAFDTDRLLVGVMTWTAERTNPDF